MNIGEQNRARRWWGRASAVSLLAVALALAAGCGNGSSESPSASSDRGDSAASGDTSDAMLNFARCMREHGVNIPDPDSRGRIKISPRAGFSPGHLSSKVQEAQKACSRYQPGPGNFSQTDQRKFQEAALKFARCMRKHGVDFPDPNFSDGGIGMLAPRGANPNDPKLRAASKACEGILPALPEQG